MNIYSIIQVIWGVLLISMGGLVFYKIPERFESLGNTGVNNIFARLSFYLLGILLIIGGIIKLVHHIKHKNCNR